MATFQYDEDRRQLVFGAAIAAVSTANADSTYGQPEADLINELKTKLNAVITVLQNADMIQLD